MEQLQEENERLKSENELLINFLKQTNININWNIVNYIPQPQKVTRQNYPAAKIIFALHPNIVDEVDFLYYLKDHDIIEDFFKTFMDTIINESRSIFSEISGHNERLFCKFLYNQYGPDLKQHIKDSHKRFKKRKRSPRETFGSAISDDYFEDNDYLSNILKEFFKEFQDIFNSVMIDSKILYWDANIISIIQPYLCLPYF